MRAWQPVAVVRAFHPLRAAREAGSILVLDGATGTELEARGAPMDDHAWCVANLTQPALVRAIPSPSCTPTSTTSPPAWRCWRRCGPARSACTRITAARMLGGCCGLGTRDVAALRVAVDTGAFT
jgi:hypothetical protein